MNDIKQIVKKSGTSFFWSMRLLPKAERQAIYTLYAFCRNVDDFVDGDYPVEEKIEFLKTWREEINNIYDLKIPGSDIGRKIYKNCMRFHLPKKEFVILLHGIAMDLPEPLNSPSLNDFYKYCRGVAGAPGNLSLRIFGCKDEKIIDSLSTSLGNALQITNILRDVKEDAQIGRVYIPKEFLQKAGITSQDPMTIVVDPNLSLAREELAKIAYEEFKRSYEIIKLLDKKIARPVKIIANVYKKYFDIMQKRGWEVISPKPRLKKFDLFKIIFKAFIGK